MLTTIEILPEQAEALDQIAAREHTSRDALVRTLIADFVAQHAPKPDIQSFFGIWRERGVDGLEYQERLRAEW
ncbi:ribbon-helix-helix protein, CopG family [Methylobacterium nodulans]|uniref:CopG domain protein DNA-binding domain protein n=1 Tax=Methylobacterium nodulans (strain LMG 21967 / CNCM I-2342 / ORS 2060) TaxID=460265 RepID=B8IY13_METNO|nr:ribbon-helix-helix protein, CopG family [Methylobacterium nodulans]ACL63303.1 CopG domain protein DNA-binding domain protein [Methylobacterium nodulans ORS 2060]